MADTEIIGNPASIVPYPFPIFKNYKFQNVEMRKPKSLKIFPVVMLISAGGVCQAQEALVSAGGDAFAEGGEASISYTIGQTIQETIFTAEGTLIQGIQIYFPSSVVKVIDLETNLDVATYPNPASSAIFIKIDGEVGSELLYRLYDLQGKSVRGDQIGQNLSEIDIRDLPAATYVLKIHNHQNNAIKTFKVIKH